MSPTAIFLFKWLQQNASSQAKSGTDRGFQTRGERRGSNDLLETSAIGSHGKGSARMDSEQKCGGKQLVMNMTAMGAVYGAVRPSWPQNSSWEDSQVLTDELLQPCDGHMAQTVRSGVNMGSGGLREWFILPPCHSLWATPLEMASNVTVLRRKISSFCLSVTAAQTDLLTSCAPPPPLALCVCVSRSSPFQGSWHTVYLRDAWGKSKVKLQQCI